MRSLLSCCACAVPACVFAAQQAMLWELQYTVHRLPHHHHHHPPRPPPPPPHPQCPPPPPRLLQRCALPRRDSMDVSPHILSHHLHQLLLRHCAFAWLRSRNCFCFPPCQPGSNRLYSLSSSDSLEGQVNCSY